MNQRESRRNPSSDRNTLNRDGLTPEIADFDVAALHRALDAARLDRGLSWQGVADSIWAMSADLNAAHPTDHPISATTLTGMATRGATSCQHALFMLRWLDRTPESFLAGAVEVRSDATLPPCGPDRRLRWNLSRLYAALDEQRHSQSLTWAEAARVLRCTPSQLTGLKTARFATGMGLAMRITQWLDRPAADFIRAAKR